jgi:sigma-E factor negative regulatory protein RseC
MISEELIEEGTVITSVNGIAEVELKENESCDECSAKLFCKPGENKSKTIKAFDPYKARAGDTVKISVSGSVILKATILLYGVPLIILILFIWLGLLIISASELRELFSFIFALAVMGLYYFFIYLYSRKHKGKLNLARIITVHRQT